MTKAKKQTINPTKKIPQRSSAAPINMQKGWINYIQTFPCNVKGVFLTIVMCREEGAFVAPLKKIVTSSPEEAARDWNIHGVFDRTIPESNTVMNVSSGRSYPWDIFVTIAEEGVTSQDVGRKICSCFAEFAKVNEDLFKFPQKYRFDNYHPAKDYEPKPLNYFISDDDTLKVMKTMYAKVNSKDTMMEDEELLCQFFGDVDIAVNIFRSLTDYEWEDV